MPSDPTMLWNAVLSLAIGGFLWWVRGIAAQLSDLRKLISVTREEIPKTYATKIEVEKDIEKIMDRFDRLDNKMDNILERISRG